MVNKLNVVIDGSNICFDASGQAHFHRLMSVSESLRSTFSTFELNIKIFTDASLRYRFRDVEKDAYNVLISTGKVSQVPAGTQADPFILSWAEANEAIVISNDLFRGYESQYPWLSERDSGRVLSHLFDNESDTWTFIERGFSVSPRSPQELAGVVSQKSSIEGSTPDSDGALQTVSASAHVTYFDPVNTDSTPQYRARVDQKNPTAFVFLVDQSASMAEIWEDGIQKMVRVADFLNDLMMSLVLASTKAGRVVPYFDVAVLGYGGGPIGSVRSLLPGTTFDNPFRSISEIESSGEVSIRMKDGEEIEVETWIAPKAEGNTPMCAALRHARVISSAWVGAHPASFPPIVFNITDGESTDGSIREAAADLCDLRTDDGNVMLWTAHITNQNAGVFQFPVLLNDETDPIAVQMFESASLIPSAMRLQARGFGLEIPDGGRAFLFNAASDDVVRMLNIGTQATRMA
jgi:hypothetical protein